MKVTRSQLKELIRQTMKEIDFKSQAAFDAHNKKHKMRKSTKVNVAGKDTTAGDAVKNRQGKPKPAGFKGDPRAKYGKLQTKGTKGIPKDDGEVEQLNKMNYPEDFGGDQGAF